MSDTNKDLQRDTEKELTKTQLKEIAEAAANTALKIYEKKKKADVDAYRDYRLRNTRLLLEQYRTLDDHCTKALSEAVEVDPDRFNFYNDIDDILDGIFDGDKEYAYVESVRRSKQRTLTIVAHVKEMIKVFNDRCYRSPRPEDHRRADIIHWRYISPLEKSAEEIAVEYNVSIRTVHYDIELAIEQLSALFFGIDMLKDLLA